MKFSEHMLFGHAVLSEGTNDYVNSRFSASIESIQNDSSLRLKVALSVDCPDMQRLVDRGQARAGVFLICSWTYLDKWFECPLGESVISVPIEDLYRSVQVRPVVCASVGLERWANERLHPEYGGVTRIDRGAVLAIGQEHRFTVDHERTKPFESIFTLAADEAIEAGTFAADLESETIVVRTHPDTKARLEEMRNVAKGRDVLINSVYLPVVMQVLADAGRDGDRHAGRLWYRVLEAKCLIAGVNLLACDPLRDAQRLLLNPFSRIEARMRELFD